MIWLTWRQHRWQGLFAVLGLAVVAALIVPTGLRMHDSIRDLGLKACLAGTGGQATVPLGPGNDNCDQLADAFEAQFGGLLPMAVLFALLPLLAGLFFGAPLVARELEQGTHRLVWTQGVGRLRWAGTKFGLIGAAAIALSAAYAALLTWWIEPLNLASGSRFNRLIYDLQGTVPISYTLFAVALGIFAGTATRKVVPAMAVTLVGFIGLRLVMALVARPHLQPLLERRLPVQGSQRPNQLNGDWIVSSGSYDAAGNKLTSGGMRFCPQNPIGPASATPDPGCGDGSYNLLQYQPASRFWTFQFIETGLFVVLAAALLALAIYRVQRRLA